MWPYMGSMGWWMVLWWGAGMIGAYWKAPRQLYASPGTLLKTFGAKERATGF
jgi:hypothetical protein